MYHRHNNKDHGHPTCKECRSYRRKQRYKEDPSKELEVNTTWRIANREKMNSLCKLHYSRNKAYYTAKSVKRSARIKCATPAWLTKNDFLAIELLYKEAALLTEATGYSWHVDHIIPLKGYNVCGLHVPENLRVIPAFENLSKGNSFN